HLAGEVRQPEPPVGGGELGADRDDQVALVQQVEHAPVLDARAHEERVVLGDDPLAVGGGEDRGAGGLRQRDHLAGGPRRSPPTRSTSSRAASQAAAPAATGSGAGTRGAAGTGATTRTSACSSSRSSGISRWTGRGRPEVR